MNDKIKNFIHAHYISVPICIVLCIIACIWLYASRTSNIDTTGIRNAENELRHAREYNQQSIEYNQRIGNTIERSQVVNERIETRINRIDELNQRTEGAITNSQEHIRTARENAINAKRIIGEGERILRNADERTQKNQDATKEQ